jgi:7-carboxy-7-deazaguanine synthase
MEIEADKSSVRLRVTEIFYSLQGESRTIGFPTTFIRLTGCPLRCQYCDTTYAFTGGNQMALPDILAEVKKYSSRFVTVTGGEPLAQKNCLPLLTTLCDAGYEVSLETSGALDICSVDNRVSRVMDLKTPGSGEVSKNCWSNIECLTPNDQVKFVLCNRDDYDWAVECLRKYRLADICEVLLSPSHREISINDLAEWVLADQLPVRVQIQLHKHIWGDTPGK